MKLSKIIRQGNNSAIIGLHREIFELHRKEFTEDNINTLFGFILENTMEPFTKWIKYNPELYTRFCKQIIERIKEKD